MKCGQVKVSSLQKDPDRQNPAVQYSRPRRTSTSQALNHCGVVEVNANMHASLKVEAIDHQEDYHQNQEVDVEILEH